MRCSWMIWFGGELVVARHAGIGARMATVVDEWCHLVGVVAELASSDDSWCLVPKLCCQFVLCTMGFFFSFLFFYLFVVPVWKVFMVMAYGVNVVVSLAIIERVYRRGAPFFLEIIIIFLDNHIREKK